jgi:hypothetical protein
MGRPSLGSRQTINLRVPDDLFAEIETARGLMTRQDWWMRAARLALTKAGQTLDPELRQHVHTHHFIRPVSTEMRDGYKIRTFACECGQTERRRV